LGDDADSLRHEPSKVVKGLQKDSESFRKQGHSNRFLDVVATTRAVSAQAARTAPLADSVAREKGPLEMVWVSTVERTPASHGQKIGSDEVQLIAT
jgi:hypothetical protein